MTVVEQEPWLEELLDDLLSIEDDDELAAIVDELSPELRTRVLYWLRTQERDSDWRSTPGRLAMHLDRTTVQTPALELIDRAIVDVVESPAPPRGGVRGLIITMPPQEGKSERVTRRGATWMLQRNKNLRIGLVSYDLTNVRRISFAIRADVDLFDGSEGNEDLGLRLRRGDKAAARWNLEDAAGGVYAIGITGGFTGRPVDALIIDDPVKDYRTADSPLISEQTWTWWQSVARPRLAPGAVVILVLTRWSDIDLAGRLKAKQRNDELANIAYYDVWTELRIPAKADHKPELGEADPMGRDPGEWMESARGRTIEQWEATDAATTSRRVWSALYQGRPAPLEGGEVKRGWFRLVPVMPVDGDDWLSSWDMKMKEKRSGDFVVGGMWVRSGSAFYLLDVLRGQYDFPTVQAAICLLHVRFPKCQRHLVENTGNGPEVMAALRRKKPGYELSEDIVGILAMTPIERELVEAQLRRGMSGLIKVNPKGSKAARLRSVSGAIEAGNVYLPENAQWVPAYVDELASFGVGGAYDDQVDMTSQALQRLTAGEESSVTVPQGRIPTRPSERAKMQPMAGRIPAHTRQDRLIREQMDRRPKPEEPEAE